MCPTRPLLTIGVPTFDRCGPLQRLLQGLVTQRTRELRPLVEIVVSDNASTDGTRETLEDLARAHELRYLRHATNLGFERNLESLLRSARGEYIWLMGDDDEVVPGFVPELCEYLRRGTADLLVIPDQRRGDPDSINLASRFGIDSPLSATLREFLTELGLFGILGGIGHSVFRRSRLQGLERVLSLGTRFPHVFLLAESFMDQAVLFLTQSGFIVPRMSPQEGEAYKERWRAEGLWIDGWLGCMRATLQLFDTGRITMPVKPTFFRMMYDQDWPLHFHVYDALAKKIFVRGEDLDVSEWDRMSRFDALLNWPGYSQRLSTLFHAATLRRSVAESCLGLVAQPEGIFQV